jgi:hypothetical protein
MANLHTVNNNVDQHDTSFKNIQPHILSTGSFKRGRPSKKNGMWKLDNGDWAKREGAEFVKTKDGVWKEKMSP